MANEGIREEISPFIIKLEDDSDGWVEESDEETEMKMMKWIFHDCL